MNFDELYKEFLYQDDPDYTVSTYNKLKWLYDKAHRAGWEQCQREFFEIVEQRRLAVSPLHSMRVSIAIASMGYKGAEND